MSYVSIVLSVVCAVLFLFLCISVYFNVKFGILIIRIQDSVEESLDMLDEKYRKISEILERPIFFDSVEIRNVVSDIKDSRDSILRVANTMSSPFDLEKDLRNTVDDKKEN